MTIGRIENKLAKLGLSNNESKIYLKLLSQDATRIIDLTNDLKLPHSVVASELSTLVRKGLISTITKRNIKYFSAANPENILQFINEDLNNLTNIENSLELILPELQSNFSSKMTLPKITYFNGEEGAKKVFGHSLELKTSPIRIYLTPINCYSLLGPAYMNRWVKKRLRMGIETMLIKPRDTIGYNLDSRYNFHLETSRKEIRRVRYLKSNYLFKATTHIVKNKVIFISSTKDGVSTIIESEEFAKMQTQIFDMIWNDCCEEL